MSPPISPSVRGPAFNGWANAETHSVACYLLDIDSERTAMAWGVARRAFDSHPHETLRAKCGAAGHALNEMIEHTVILPLEVDGGQGLPVVLIRHSMLRVDWRAIAEEILREEIAAMRDASGDINGNR